MADTKLSTEVKDVLSRSVINGNVLVLPEGQLDRKLYEAVNKALTSAGGKWKRGQGHIFPSDAAPKLAAMLGSGVSVDEKKRDQSFFTPLDLAEEVVDIADVRGCDVLEPSAGRGALVTACLDAGAARVFAIEKNKEYAQDLESAAAMYSGYDFLELTELWGGRLFNRVVMNPPFTKNQDIKHVNHALTFLAPGGILVAIMLDNQTRKSFQEIVAKYDTEIIEVERGAFKESGTMIPTIIVKIQKV
jgi:predicted RNA methylase